MTTTSAIPIAEFDQEMASTRRMLERLPADRIEWKPHVKSFPLGHLALLIAWMPSWVARTLREPEIDLAGGADGKGSSYTFRTPEEILAEFDRSVKSGREALQQVTGDVLEQPWSLKMKGQAIMTLPKGAAVRGHLNHFIHHRGQLSVYLRLCDVPLPQVYGPTADEKW
jgi:uncharacterized damage-inducible protein DinB